MQVICELVKKGICGVKFKPSDSCRHVNPHFCNDITTVGYCSIAKERCKCIPIVDPINLELPDDLF